MSDIVERLREAAANLSEIYPDYAEAADEITRLREENARLQDIIAREAKERAVFIRKQADEIVRLRKAFGYFTARETSTQWLYKRERAEELARAAIGDSDE